MKICYICSEYPPALHGGIGSVTQSAARALVSKGHRVRIIGISPNSQKALPYEEDQGVEVSRLQSPADRFGWVASRYRLFKRVQEWAQKGELDVIELPDWEGMAAGWPPLKIPVVVRLHGSRTYFESEMQAAVSRKARWLEVRSFRRADFCSSCSRYTAQKTEELFGKPKKPARVIYNAVVVGRKKGINEPCNPNLVVYAGTLTRKKGVIQLIKAWPRVVAASPDARLYVYGKDEGTDDGQPMEPYLRSLLGPAAAQTVQFHGHVPAADLRAVYRRCRLAVFPSYSEAFALAPLEAMAEGCPVISSNRASGPEMIVNGSDGLLIDPDDEAGLAAAIGRLLNSDSLAARLGEAGQETVCHRFSSLAMADQLLNFYAECCATFRA